MAAVIFTPLSDAVLFMETVEHEAEIRSVLTASGYHDEQHQAGRCAVQGAMATIARAQGMQSDTSAEHLVHTAATEIEMWLQATRRRIRLGTSDMILAARLTGEGVHFRHHSTSVMASARRALAVLRNDPAMQSKMGGSRAMEDMLQRGHTLCSKLVRVAEDMVRPEHTSTHEFLAPAASALVTWNTAAQELARHSFASEPMRLGLLGVLAGDAAAIGGTGYSVTRHAQTTRNPPSGGPAPGPSGWTLGRQGRNAANRGKGYGPVNN